MNELQIFSNPEFGEVRTADIDGKTYLCGTDVAKALGYTNANKAVNDHCRAITKRSTPISGKMQEINFISEGDVYRLIVKSNLPKAEKFEKWIFDEVLPTIRKYGGYLTPAKIEEALLDPDTIIQLALTLKQEREQRKLLQEQLDESKEWYSIKRVAQLNGVDWRTFDWRKLKDTSIAIGRPPRKIFDANYTEVNVYHCDAWARVYPKYEL